jgi:hypothetical protein
MAARTITVARAVVALAVGVCGLGVLMAQSADDGKKLDDRNVAAWVQKRVQDWQPAAEDRRFDEIGWARDIRAAEKLAKDNNRPVFLFTHDGHMDVGRC